MYRCPPCTASRGLEASLQERFAAVGLKGQIVAAYLTDTPELCGSCRTRTQMCDENQKQLQGASANALCDEDLLVLIRELEQLVEENGEVVTNELSEDAERTVIELDHSTTEGSPGYVNEEWEVCSISTYDGWEESYSAEPSRYFQASTATRIGEPLYLPPVTAPAEGAPLFSAMPPQGAIFAAPATQAPVPATTVGEAVYPPPITAPAEVPATTIGEAVYLPPITAPAEGAIFAAPAMQVPATTIGEAVYLPPITAPAEGAPLFSAMPPQGAIFAAPAAQAPVPATTIGEAVYLPPITAPAEGAPLFSAMPAQGAIFAAPAMQAVYLPPITAPAEGAPLFSAMPPQGAIFEAPAMQAPVPATTIGEAVYLPPITAPAQACPPDFWDLNASTEELRCLFDICFIGNG
eukprot:s2188_g7.t2